MLFAILGLICGSFINVCIYRLPKNLSVVLPASHCPQCKTVLRFFDNIPIISFLLLKGRCRFCKERIALHYPLVELCTALLWVVAAFYSDSLASAIINALFSSVLLCLSVIDFFTLTIPDEIVICIAALGLSDAFFIHKTPFIERILGGMLGGGILLLVAIIVLRLAKMPGLGGGDIKMMAACGLFLGMQKTLTAIYLAPFLGLIGVGISFIFGQKISRRMQIPFGPALAAGCFIAMYWGERIFGLLFSP